MALHEKVANDIAGGLFNVLQGYKDHIDYCQGLIDQGNLNPVDDGLSSVDSKLVHASYIAELEALLVNIGINPNALSTEETLVENIVVEKQEGAD